MIISFSLRMWLHFSSSVNYQLSTWAEYQGIHPGWPTLKSPSWIASATSELVIVSTVNTGGAHVVTCDHSQVTNTTESQWAWAVAGPAAGERLCPLCSNQASRAGPGAEDESSNQTWVLQTLLWGNARMGQSRQCWLSMTPQRLETSLRNCDLNSDWGITGGWCSLCLLPGLNEVVMTSSRWVQLIASPALTLCPLYQFMSQLWSLSPLSSANDLIRW